MIPGTTDRIDGHAWRSRPLSIALVLLIHALILVALLVSFVAPVKRQIPRERETVLYLPKPEEPHIPSASPKREHAPHAAPFRITPPPPNRSAIPETLPQSLFGCAPENLANLGEEARERCAAAFGRLAVGGPDLVSVRERSKHGAEWRAAIVGRNTPVRVPCTYTQNVSAGAGTGLGVMVDPICMLRNAAEALQH